MFTQAGFSDGVLSGSSYSPPVLSGSKASLPELETSPYHCKSDQILVRLQEAGSRGANSFLCFLLVSCLFTPPHHRSRNKHKTDFWLHPHLGGWGVGALHTAPLSEQSRGGVRGEKGGRAAAVGAPGTWNVNWEDCFNKAPIFANAGRGLAAGGGHTGGRAAHSQILSANNVK